mmetsp:Transcript_59658/g.122371  ORF Transcript_59658/g.122371 Transcript_59658/m.122371 type:complete len:207 (-) Transcript_59658:2893-3513(-)
MLRSVLPSGTQYLQLDTSMTKHSDGAKHPVRLCSITAIPPSTSGGCAPTHMSSLRPCCWRVGLKVNTPYSSAWFNSPMVSIDTVSGSQSSGQLLPISAPSHTPFPQHAPVDSGVHACTLSGCGQMSGSGSSQVGRRMMEKGLKGYWKSITPPSPLSIFVAIASKRWVHPTVALTLVCVGQQWSHRPSRLYPSFSLGTRRVTHLGSE